VGWLDGGVEGKQKFGLFGGAQKKNTMGGVYDSQLAFQVLGIT
jgi:hypothetical protein